MDGAHLSMQGYTSLRLYERNITMIIGVLEDHKRCNKGRIKTTLSSADAE